MVDRFEKKWTSQPETGFRVGIGASPILVKKIGIPRHPDKQRPVWAGRAVNYASKAGSAADRHELVVTGTIWDRIENNDYLTLTCDCGTGPSDALWENVTIERLRKGDEADAAGRLLTSDWCAVHGEEFCEAILSGTKTRPAVDQELRNAVLESQTMDAFRARARRWRTGGETVR